MWLSMAKAFRVTLRTFIHGTAPYTKCPIGNIVLDTHNRSAE